MTECAIDTPEGTFVADVTWASNERLKIIENEFSCSVAPEICVEIWSPSNTPEELSLKRQLYIAKGALEVWLCDDAGALAVLHALADNRESLARYRALPDALAAGVSASAPGRGVRLSTNHNGGMLGFWPGG